MKLKFCAVCGTTKELQHHHLVPKIRGGTDDETNLLTLCYEHHCWFHKVKPSSYTKQSELIKAGLKRAAKVGIKPGRKPKYQDICAIHQIRNLPFKKPLPFEKVSKILFILGHGATSPKNRSLVPFKRDFCWRSYWNYSALDPKEVYDTDMLMGLVEDEFPLFFYRHFSNPG